MQPSKPCVAALTQADLNTLTGRQYPKAMPVNPLLDPLHGLNTLTGPKGSILYWRVTGLFG